VVSSAPDQKILGSNVACYILKLYDYIVILLEIFYFDAKPKIQIKETKQKLFIVIALF